MQRFHLFTASVRGDRRNTVYPHACEIHDLEQLRQAVQFDHVAAAFRDNKRSTDGFLWADCIIADVDNTTGPVVHPAQIADDLPGVEHCIIFSRHHMTAKGSAPAVPRFHVLFPILRTDSRAHVEQLKRALCNRFPYYDAACVDAARFFFGVEQPRCEAVEDILLLDDTFTDEELRAAETPVEPSAELIPEGSRNDTLSRAAFQLLKRLGADDGQARETFERKAAQCAPPLGDDELEIIWRAALRAYRAKVEGRAGYLTPAEYALQGMQSGSMGDTLRPIDFTTLSEARIFTQQNKGRVLYNGGLGWLVWDGARFAADEAAAHRLFHALTDSQMQAAREEVKNAAAAGLDEGSSAKGKSDAAKAFAKFVCAQRSGSGIRATLGEAQHLCAVNVEELDSDPYLLNCPGSSIDLRTGESKPNNPADRCTKLCAVDPSDRGTREWEAFVDKFTCGDKELAAYLQLVAGAAAVGHVFHEALIIAYGSGGKGKSTFFNVLARVLGDYSGTLSADALTANPNRNKLPELAELRGKRLVLAAELEEGVRLDVSMLKRLCSTDAIHAEPKYRQPFTFIPSHTAVLFTNFLPKVGSSDSGTWSRLVVVPCRASFRGQAGEVKDYGGWLFDHAGGAVLAWVIQGAQRFIAGDYRLDPPRCVREAVEQYREENDWLQHFLDECCDVGEEYSVSAGQLLSVYRCFCQTSHEFARRTDELKAALEGRGFFWKRTMNGAFYYGLRLAPDYI